MDPAALESLIVREIRKSKEISRRDLAEKLSIAKSTAGRRIDSMIERGLVRESGIEDRKGVGRPRRFLALCGGYGAYAGFDFDARHLYGVLIDFAQATLERRKIRFSAHPDRNEVLARIAETLAEFRSLPACPRLIGTGIGVPGHVHREERVGLYYPYVEGWRNVDLASELGIDPAFLHIENNTRTVALSEYWLGPWTGTDHLLCLSVRTGISAAVVANGALVTGRHEMAGEIRGWPVGGDLWLEKAASVRSVIDGEPPGSDKWRDFVTQCRNGDGEALATLAKAAGHHGEAVARMIQLLDPSAVFLSGPFTDLDSLYLDRVRSAVAGALDGNFFSPPPIRPTSLGEFSGAHGAAAMAAAETLLTD
jgi:predicted NBD/HSP70 family sugar kinase